MQNLDATGRQSNTNCTRVDANCMQIVPAWLPVAWKFPSILFIMYPGGPKTYGSYGSGSATLVQVVPSTGNAPQFCLHRTIKKFLLTKVASLMEVERERVIFIPNIQCADGSQAGRYNSHGCRTTLGIMKNSVLEGPMLKAGYVFAYR